MKHLSKSLVCLLLVLLLAAAALTGCAQNPTASTEAPKTQAQTEAPKTEGQTEAPKTEAPDAELQELGEGSSLFYLEVGFADGSTASYAIHSDAETVGAALTELELIEGENGMYTTVCGKTLDWDADHMYWAFYIEGEYASTGLDDTPITQEAHYALTATEG
ncbi:MAG: hypothetical protein IKQ04_09230 [Oscillospiraceae bacterium]|nr:hypothetical protein [Oscillospiraceae bacterium]